MRTLTSLRSVALGSVIALGLVAARPAAALQPTRIVTYNTALMALQADVYIAATPGVPVPLTIDTNRKQFGAQSYFRRIELMAGQIKKEDPDVVVLNEVWDDADKDKFIEQLSQFGPYDNYIRKVQGPIPGLNNPFAAPGVQNEIEFWGDFLGTGTGSALLTFITSVLPLPPPFIVTGLDIKYQD